MINWNLFNSYLSEMDREQVHDLIMMFTEPYPGHLERLRKAVAEKDYKVVDSIAHDIKYYCNLFGDTAAGDLALALENMGKRKTEDHMTEVLPGMEAAVEEVIRELREYMKK